MVNYFYNIILKTDDCDLYSDILTGIRKDYYLSHEKQKGKITQNSSSNTLFYEFSIEKDRPIRWRVSDEKCIISDSKILDGGTCCVNYYDDNGLYKVITFSKFHTLLKVEYYNMAKSTSPYCTIEPRKSGDKLCLLLTSGIASVQSSVLYCMPNIYDDYILDKIQNEFTDYTAIASTNEGVVKFLSENQLEKFEDFVDRAAAIKLTENSPKSYIDEGDAVLAQKLNPKDFNVKRNLSEIIDISQAKEFSYDNIEEELLTDMGLELFEEETDLVDDEYNDCSSKGEHKTDVELTEISAENIEAENNMPVALKAENDKELLADSHTEVEFNDLCEETEIDSHENFEEAFYGAPNKVIESSSAKYQYFGELDENNKRSGFGRTATESGRTAYEGEYLDNKRNGVGAYYYKDSQLCYYGEWKDNKREGFGVGVSSVDKSIHVGNFYNNKPTNEGVRINADGEIEFIKKVLSNGIVVEFRFENDKIIVSKFNEKGEQISENSSNLLYF